MASSEPSRLRVAVAALGLLLLLLWPITVILGLGRVLDDDLRRRSLMRYEEAPAILLGLTLATSAVWFVVQRRLSVSLRQLLSRPHILLPYVFWALGVGAAFLVNVEAGSLDLGAFFGGASPLIGAVIVGLVFEGKVERSAAASADQKPEQRGVGVAFILSGAICATLGLVTPARHHSGYLLACFFMAVCGSLAAACAVMMDSVLLNTPLRPHDDAPLLRWYLQRVHLRAVMQTEALGLDSPGDDAGALEASLRGAETAV